MHEKQFGQILKNWNFSVSIDRALIECQSSQADSNQKIFIAISIGREIASINRKFGKVKIWKTEQVNAETPQNTIFHKWNAWVWD